MFMASNVINWLPSLLESLNLPDWVVSGAAPNFIIYSLASAINMVILKKFVFEDEIQSEFKTNKKNLKSSRTLLTKANNALDENQKALDKLKRKNSALERQEVESKKNINDMCHEIDVLQAIIEQLNANSISISKRYLVLKAKQSNDYNDDNDDNHINNETGYMKK